MTDGSGIGAERPLMVPLGDSALVVRFGTSLDDGANRAALALAAHLAHDPIDGVCEVVPSLVSVLVRYDPKVVSLRRLSGEVALRLGSAAAIPAGRTHVVAVRFGGAEGPDLVAVAAALGLEAPGFVEAHNSTPLRVLTTGFAPGFVYCGFHPDRLVLPRRMEVRNAVPAGSILFAAGQTAIAATEIPTGWHVIGRTTFRNFDAGAMPPTTLRAGDRIVFEAVA